MPLHYLHLGEVRGEAGERCLDTMSRKAGQQVRGSSSIRKDRRTRTSGVFPFRLACPTVMVWGVTRSLLLPRSFRWASEGGGVGSGG